MHLRDDQFARIKNFLPGRPGTVGRNSDRGKPPKEETAGRKRLSLAARDLWDLNVAG
jgi:hypothetical protein